MKNKFIKSKKGSSSIEAAILIMPIFLIAFIFVSMFNKNGIEINTSYALKEAVGDAVIQPDYDTAEDKATQTFTETLSMETKKDGTPKYELNNNMITFEILDTNRNPVAASNINWCKDYFFKITAVTKSNSSFIRNNHFYNDSVFSSAVNTEKTMIARIENAPVCN